eukprot:TRINITY_DN15118_c0_g1_i1.p1 TRINITY_DN15118_c0_g1~~TRINITY_DN15118_c0_g1_i1.p1  ORF type:complete len:199 (+),score=60.69 TRINITY_DN15118_c0_g1_i1:90-686(+)
MDQEYTVNLYSVNSYNFGNKDARIEKDKSVPARLARMKDKYEKEGLRRVVEAVMIVHEHNHPHVLLLQIGNFFKLPGGKLRPGEGEVEGLKRKLTNKLAPPEFSVEQPDWEVSDLLCKWWRIHFENTWYPYVPAHITKPKECRKLYLIPLPENCTFAVPQNLNLLAVPLVELYDNCENFGPVISSIPQVLAKYNFVYL